MKITNAIKLIKFCSDFSNCKKLGELAVEGYLLDTGWFLSAKKKQPLSALNSPIPWYTYPSIDFINENLPVGLKIFEFGSGNSSLFFADKGAKVTSVENDQEWMNKVKSSLPQNCSLIYCELDTNGKYANSCMTTAIEYDIIIVDGRDRVNCFKSSISCLNTNGVIILDDSERTEYSETYNVAKKLGFKHINFWGMAPGVINKKCTTIFYRMNNIFGI